MRLTLKKVLSTLTVALLLLTVVYYSYFQSRAIIAGPQITILEPENGITTTSPLVLIRGVATHAKEITLNGRQILIDLDGRFAEHLLLAEGYNIIGLTARDAQGKQVEERLELVYQNPSGEHITP